MSNAFSRALLVVSAVLATQRGLDAAHLFAAVPGGVGVYQVNANGSLALRQTVASSPVKAMAVTANGKYLFTTDGASVFTYAVRDDGSIQAAGAPLAIPYGVADLAVHATSGSALYVLSKYAMSVYRINDANGSLTDTGQATSGPNYKRLAASPFGDYVMITGQVNDYNDHGAVAVGTNPDGLINYLREGPALPAPIDADRKLSVEGRFVYIATGSSVTVLSLAGQSGVQQAGQQSPVGPLIQAIGGHYLASSQGGKGSTLQIYNVVFTTDMIPCDQAAIEVYAMAKGRGAWDSALWVATDDGIVSYALSETGKLTRVSKAAVNGASLLAFGMK